MKNMVLLWSTRYETHYMKNMVLLWSTSLEKEIVTLPLFIIFIFFFGLSFFFLAFFLGGQCSNNDDHHTFIYLQLDITTRYWNKIWLCMNASGSVPGCAISSVAKISKMDKPWKYHASYLKIMQSIMIELWSHVYDDDGSCMAIYLRMAMEMPW